MLTKRYVKEFLSDMLNGLPESNKKDELKQKSEKLVSFVEKGMITNFEALKESVRWFEDVRQHI